MSTAKAVFRSTRPSFLVLTPVCVLLACATVVLEGQPISPTLLALVLVGALAAHIAVNTLNEYEDFRSGLDSITNKTPFSGGSGALPANPEAASAVLLVAILSLGITIGTGVAFIHLQGPAILIPGVLGIVIILTYTRWLNRSAILCLIAPGLAYGPLMIFGTDIALGAGISTTTAWLALPPFFLVNNLLLANQLPDIDADIKVGRAHLPIQYGAETAVWVYAVFLLLCYLSIVIAVWQGLIPLLALLTLASAVLGWKVVQGLWGFAQKSADIEKYLGMNVGLTLVTIVLLALSIIFGSGGEVSL